MGRSVRKASAVEDYNPTGARSAYSLREAGHTHDSVGGRAHRERLSRFARQRIRSVQGRDRDEVRVLFENYCSSCQHRLQDHLDPRSSCQGMVRNRETGHERLCGCGNYTPGGGSRTNMKGRIVVQSDVPPDGEPWERHVCIDGLLRHELCHELYTDPEEFQKLQNLIARVRKEGSDPNIARLHDVWNILEDGRIETIEMNEQEGSYQFIDGLNLLYPRVPYPDDDQFHVLSDAARWRVPPGYTAQDAYGNPLTNVEVIVDPETGEEKHYLHVPAGTAIATWGENPVSLPNQVRSAILASSVPGFQPGDLHPEVARVLGLCQPHIDAATQYGASSAEAIAHAQSIYNILKDNNMLMEPEEKPTGGYPVPPTEEEPVGNPDGPQPPPPPDNPEGGEEGGEKGDGEGGEKGDGEGGEKGDGEGGEEGDGEGGEKGEGGGDKNKGGGASSDSSYNPEADLPITAEEREERKKELEKNVREDIEDNMEADRRDDTRQDNSRRSQRDFRAEDFDTPDGESVRSQSEMTSDIEEHNSEEALPDERSKLQRLGQQLADELQAMKEVFEEPRRYRPQGVLDKRRLPAVAANDIRVFETRRRNAKVDMEVAIVIDRSGSVMSNGRDETPSQFRMARMCGHASNVSGVPIGIYGFSGSGGGVEHFAYKEPRSEDLRGIDAIFKSGGGTTPTAEAVAFATARLEAARSQDRVMVVVTDGDPDQMSTTEESIRSARAQGIRVVGIGFTGKGLNEGRMDKLFGEGQWHEIDDYEKAPEIVSGLIQDTAGQGMR